MSGQSKERFMKPFIIGATLLFFIGVTATVVLPFYDEVMQRENANAKIKNYAIDSPEYRGRQVYIREGCHVCHTQFVRPVKADSSLGPVSVPEDYRHDYPHLLGTVRTGSDLTWVGTRWNEQWHRVHLNNPRQVFPGSTMPRYDYLSDQDTEDLIAYLMSLKPAPSTEGR